jgi:hypothetical protein
MRLAGTLLALAMVALAAASPAEAVWSHERVASGAADYGEVALAANERGDAALLFERRPGLSLALARPGGNFGRPRAVPRVGDESDAGVAVDERGDVLVVWNYNDHTKPAPSFSRDDDCCERIRVALLPKGAKRFSGPKTLGPAGTDAYLQAFSLVNGRVGIGWSEGGQVVARFSRRGLRLGGAVRASGDQALAAAPLRTAPVLTFWRYRYTGGLTVSWTLFDLVVPGGRAPVVRKLLSRVGQTPSIGLAANSHGDQVLAWSQPTGRNSYDVFAGARTRGAQFHPRLLSRAGSFDVPGISIGRTGSAVVAWTDSMRIFTAARPAGHGFGKAIVFRQRRKNAFVSELQVASDVAGRAVLSWRQESAQSFEREHAALRSRGGRMLNERDFGPVSNFGSPETTALDEHGIARVAWANGPPYVALGRFPR